MCGCRLGNRKRKQFFETRRGGHNPAPTPISLAASNPAASSVPFRIGTLLLSFLNLLCIIILYLGSSKVLKQRRRTHFFCLMLLASVKHRTWIFDDPLGQPTWNRQCNKSGVLVAVGGLKSRLPFQILAWESELSFISSPSSSNIQQLTGDGVD